MEKLVTITLRVTDTLRDEIQASAQDSDQSQADWLRDAVEHYIAIEEGTDIIDRLTPEDQINIIENHLNKMEDSDEYDEIKVESLREWYDELKENYDKFDDDRAEFSEEDLGHLVYGLSDCLNEVLILSDNSDEADQETDEQEEE